MQLQFVGDEGDELTIGGFSLGVGNRVSEEPLEGIQVATIPGHFDGVSDGSFHSGRGGLEGLCHLGVQYLGDGIGVPYGPPGGFQKGMIWRGICEGLIALFVAQVTADSLGL